MSNSFPSITVEPTLFLFIIAYEWMKELDSNLFLQKACRFNITQEPDLNSKCDDEKRGILFVSEVRANYDIVISLLNIIFVIFASVWSDDAGRRRRPIIFISLFGIMSNALSGCLHSYFWHWIPSNAALSCVIIQSITGGYDLMVSFTQLYICDISDPENRTMQLGLYGVIKVVGKILGKGGFGFILRSIGFFYFYALCFVLSVASVICGLVFIKDSSVAIQKNIWFHRMFRIRHLLLIDSFKVVFSKKLGGRRVIVLLLIMVNIASIFTIYGEMAVLYLYLRYRFKWDERMYSKYLFCKFFAAPLGVLFCSFVLSKRLKLHDGLIGMFASFCDTMAVVGLLFAKTTWQLFLNPVMDMFHGMVFILSMSFMSKYYHSDELGRLNAVNSTFMLIVPLCYPIYSTIFQKTLDTFPSAFCLPSIVLSVGIFICYVGSYVLSQKFEQKESTVKEKELMVHLK